MWTNSSDTTVGNHSFRSCLQNESCRCAAGLEWRQSSYIVRGGGEGGREEGMEEGGRRGGGGRGGGREEGEEEGGRREGRKEGEGEGKRGLS